MDSKRQEFAIVTSRLAISSQRGFDLAMLPWNGIGKLANHQACDASVCVCKPFVLGTFPKKGSDVLRKASREYRHLRIIMYFRKLDTLFRIVEYLLGVAHYPLHAIFPAGSRSTQTLRGPVGGVPFDRVYRYLPTLTSERGIERHQARSYLCGCWLAYFLLLSASRSSK